MLIRRELRKLIKYNRLTGLVITNCPLSLQERGHVQIRIDGDNHRLTNVLWILVHGTLPEQGIITQKNGCKIDFTLDNLELDTDKMFIRKYNLKIKEEKIAREKVKVISGVNIF